MGPLCLIVGIVAFVSAAAPVAGLVGVALAEQLPVGTQPVVVGSLNSCLLGHGLLLCLLNSSLL